MPSQEFKSLRDSFYKHDIIILSSLRGLIVKIIYESHHPLRGYFRNMSSSSTMFILLRTFSDDDDDDIDYVRTWKFIELLQ